MSLTRTVRETGGSDDEVLTPRGGVVLRRSLFWIAIALALLILAGAVTAALGSQSTGRLLASDEPAPTGGMALVEVLRDNGVEVIATGSLDATREAAERADDPAIFIHDDDMILDTERIRGALGLTSRLVIADPDFAILAELDPDIAIAGQMEGLAEAGCAIPAAERAEEIRVDGTGYSLLDGADAESCFTADDMSSVVQFEASGTTVTVLGSPTSLSNQHIATRGNAALALGLLGESDTLIWYLPDASDLDEAAPLTFEQLLPGWMSPLAILMLVVAIALAVWRGRRFGPLVVENMPVVVPASETMEGRARLYARGSARLHALDALRIGTIARLASASGLPRSATVPDVIDAVAGITGRQRTDVAALLVDDDPPTDSDLVRLSDGLLELERDVAARVHPR